MTNPKTNNIKFKLITVCTLFSLILCFTQSLSSTNTGGENIKKTIKLPEPKKAGIVTIEQTLETRRSLRNYQDKPLTLLEIGQLLWAAQGITGKDEFHRTAPSAGAKCPLEIYIAAGNITKLPAGIYKYDNKTHSLEEIVLGDKREELCTAAHSQKQVKNAPVVIIFAAVFERTTDKYGQRGRQYVYTDLGHSAQNVCLQATSLGLGVVPMGAFDDSHIRKITQMPENETAVYLMPAGKK